MKSKTQDELGVLHHYVNLIRLMFSTGNLSFRPRKCSNIYMFEYKSMNILRSTKPYQNSTLIKQAIGASES